MLKSTESSLFLGADRAFLYLAIHTCLFVGSSTIFLLLDSQDVSLNAFLTAPFMARLLCLTWVDLISVEFQLFLTALAIVIFLVTSFLWIIMENVRIYGVLWHGSLLFLSLFPFVIGFFGNYVGP